MKIKLATALLRRKELNNKLATMLSPLKDEGIKQRLFEVKATRRKVTDEVDDILLQVPKLSMEQVTAAYDWCSKNLRLVDAAIQQANWTTEIDVDASVMEDFVDPYMKPQS